MPSDIKKNLDHSYAAYKFAINSLPKGRHGRTVLRNSITVSGYIFTKQSQIYSMMIEFGWSFYCRFEACLESFIEEHEIKLSKTNKLEDWLSNKKIQVPKEFVEDLKQYRQIRNKLHHDDGQKADGTEIELLPDDMDRFYNLFVWISATIVSKSLLSAKTKE
jgi:hypothetical protein